MHLNGKYHPFRLSLDGKAKSKSNISTQDAAKKEGLQMFSSLSTITESEVMRLVQEMYGQSIAAVIIYECPLGTLFDPITCLCDFPENVNTGLPYPEIFMAIIDFSLFYELVPYPFSFHPFQIVPDPEYPDEPIDDETYDCAGVLNGSAYMAECGCIGGTTGIEDCSCEVFATMDPINAAVKPGDKINLSATIQKGSGVAITDKFFEVYYKGTWFNDGSIKSDDLPIDQGNSYILNNAEINVLGELKYRLRIDYTCNNIAAGTIYSNVVSTNSQYEASAFIAKFAAEIESAWSQTKESSIANQGTKFEFGFTGYYSRTDREIIIDGEIFNASTPCGTATLNLPLSGRGLPGTINPGFGADFTVGSFHTHPPLTYCSSNESLVSGPSIIDKDGASNSKFPWIVRTYTTTVSGGHNISLPFTDHFANSKTVTNY